MRAALLLPFIASAAAMTCSAPTGPEFDLLIALEDSALAKRSPNEVNLSVNVRVSNHDTRTVYYDGCGHSVQRREGNEWRPVFSPVCPPSLYSFELLPGESRILNLGTRVPASSTEWPAVGAAGDYRVVLWLSATPRNTSGIGFQPLSTASRTSPTFSVREVVIVF